MVIAADSYKLKPTKFDTLITTAGERYDFVLDAVQPDGGSYLLFIFDIIRILIKSYNYFFRSHRVFYKTPGHWTLWWLGYRTICNTKLCEWTRASQWKKLRTANQINAEFWRNFWFWNCTYTHTYFILIPRFLQAIERH